MKMLVLATTLALCTACNSDKIFVCDLLGRPTVALQAFDFSTGVAVPLAGSVLTFTTGGGTRTVDTSPQALGTTNQYTDCCAVGPVSVHLAQTGYLSFDTALVVPDSGPPCHHSVVQSFVARLKRPVV